MKWQRMTARKEAASFKRMPMKWHRQLVRRLRARCLTLMPMEWQCMAVREKAALFNVNAHEVALTAREEAASAMSNADALEWHWQPMRRLHCLSGCP